MPTFYKRQRGSSRADWTEEQLKDAINAVQNGMSLNQASKEFGVPWSTLKRRIANGCFTKKALGGPPVLTQECEKKMVKRIIKLQKFGFAPTRTEVRIMAYKLAEKCNQHHKFNREKEIAGMDWLHLFLKRNPELSVRKSEAVSLARSRGLNKKNVSDYFSLLRNILIEHNLLDKPGNIFNVDESGLQLNNRPGHVVAAKGSKSVAAITSGEKGETITVIACCNGEGTFLPPACVLKGKNEKAEYRDGMPPGSIIFMSQKSAYVTTDIFLLWLRNHFAPRKPEGTVVLILDGHSSHCSSVDTLEFAEENNIILLCLPSHTTHYLQPLDRAFFKALKSYYYNACNSYIKMNPNRKISRLVFGGLLSKAWVQASTTDNAISGFRSTGIIPFNADAIPEYAFLTSASGQQENNERREKISTSPQPGCSHWQEIPNPSAEATAEVDNNQGIEHMQASPQLGCLQRGKNLQKNIHFSSEATDFNTNIVNLRNRKCQNKTSIESVKSGENAKKKAKGKTITKETTKNKQRKKRKASTTDTESDSSLDMDLEDDDDDDVDDEECCCVGCSELCRCTKKDVDWVKCISCQLWLHEDCSRYESMCHICGKKQEK
ncbi:unnamed protein product [Acanthoscelides obtectus]|uniref:HTH psq-type domain-containing protein n=1 Tax=Acanthoscelides obtectus TaxID=200917 RepID=A0A9P0P171_ACAOB|nr:unnamed protein product [Acanthoscelides obtectus]CAK1628072.1 Tigger transposable element-derived protein 1 [Acanthoscelides obtectus]